MSSTSTTKPSARLRTSRVHRRLGMIATIPIVGWIVSSFVLHGVGLTLPNGLQGVYELETPDGGGGLESDEWTSPDDVLASLAHDGIDRVYWLRLERLGQVPVWVVKPGPFELERVYDAQSGERLDPLPEEVLRAVADEHLVDTRAGEIHEGAEFNRYYTVDRVPAVAVRMEGDQPSEVVFSLASGRVLRRTDQLAEWFHRAYRSVHVWQWGDALGAFTALLYGLVGVALVLVGLGYTLWWLRRDARRRWTDAVRPARRVHGRLAPIAGFLLATQMLVGAYLWFNLGLIEPRFRGQGSFEAEWSGGISTSESLPAPSAVLEAVSHALGAGDDVVRYEWRAVADRRFALAYPDPHRDGVLLDLSNGTVLDRLTPQLAARAGAAVVNGEATDAGVESTEYWMDFNARVPTYRFRFSDPDDTDVHVSQVTGEVVQRRPGIWRAFGPFLAYHTFGFTGNPWFDTVLLTVLQLSILVMVFSGWRLALRERNRPRSLPSSE